MSKKNQWRECPAAGKPIQAYECGLGSHTVYACPESCPFNKFATQNYEACLEVEQKADAKFFEWLLKHFPIPPKTAGVFDRALEGEPQSEFFHTFAWLAFYEKNSDGDTCLDKMGRQGFPGMNHDEQLILGARARMRPVVAEVRRVLDDRRIEAVDLLDVTKRPFILVDRTLAGVAVRFGVYAVHCFPLPHFHRLYGTAFTIPTMHPLEPEEVVREIIRHCGGGTEEGAMRAWLKEHYRRFEEAVLAVGLARRKNMFDLLDAQFGKAVYELTEPFDACKQRIEEVPQIQEDPLAPAEQAEGFEEGRVWFATPEDPEHEMVEGAVLGRLLLGKARWRLEAAGGSRLDRLRGRFESLMGPCVRFVAERRDDIATQMKLRDPAYDPSLVPPVLLRDPQQMRVAFSRVPAPAKPMSLEAIQGEYEMNQRKQWLDDPVPALSGKTPRQAATEPSSRSALVRMMKEQIRDHDTRCLETGRSDDLNWMVRELGLTEILFDPPPPRPPVKLFPDAQEFTGGEDLPNYLDWPDPEPLPDQLLTHAEARARFEAALASFPTMTAPVDYLCEMGYPLFEDMRELAGEFMNDREHQFFAPLVSLLVLCYAPKGTCPPTIDFEDLAQAFSCSARSLDLTAPEGQIHQWISTSRQPELLALLLSFLLTASEKVPKELRPSESAQMGMTVLLRAVTDELDRLMREPHPL